MNPSKCIKIIISVLTVLIITTLNAYSKTLTHKAQREVQFTNKQVNVWRTIIYPGSAAQELPMHRHDKNRVLVALTEGSLKITNNKGQIHYLHLKKGQAYYLTKDMPHELHKDENVSKHPIKVMVIELL